jgi:hypothetical protein
VCRVKLEKDVAEWNRLVAKLDEDRTEESMIILFFGVFEVEKEISDVCWPGI